MATKTEIRELRHERRHVLPTKEAAAHLNRAQQTLRLWASQQDGPIQPVRVHGRLGWRTEDIKRLLGVE